MADKDVTVKVILHPASDPKPFHFETSDLPMGPDNHLYFRNCVKGDHFRVHYVLDNSARPGFLFPTGSGTAHLLEALWVHKSTACPTSACTWNEFEAKSVEQGGLELIVKNKNDDRAQFCYSLRVTDGSQWLLLDPGGTNGNGGYEPFTWAATALTGAVVGIGSSAMVTNALEAQTALTYGLGGALVGAIIGFLFGRR